MVNVKIDDDDEIFTLVVALEGKYLGVVIKILVGMQISVIA